MDDKQKKGCFGCLGCLGVIFLAIIVMIIIFSLTSGESDDKLKPFNFTVDEYEAALTSIIDNDKGNYAMSIQDKQLNDDGTYVITLSGGIFVYIYPDDKGMVKKVGMAASSSTFITQSKKVKNAFGSLIASVDDTLSVPQRLVTLDKLGITGNADMLDHKGSYTINDIDYTYVGDIKNDSVMMAATISKYAK